jgi:4-aminobutyrate aminotransferase-like enzyme
MNLSATSIDVLTVGKMTQACATLFTEEFNPKPGLLSGTFTGETVAFRVGSRVLQRLRDGALPRRLGLQRPPPTPSSASTPPISSPGTRTGSRLSRPSAAGETMMRLTAFGGEKSKINAACKACLDEGVIVFYCGHGPFHLRLLPPLGVFKDADWPRVFAVIERALAKVK